MRCAGPSGVLSILIPKRPHGVMDSCLLTAEIFEIRTSAAGPAATLAIPMAAGRMHGASRVAAFTEADGPEEDSAFA
jgi:hypothetical protein